MWRVIGGHRKGVFFPIRNKFALIARQISSEFYAGPLPPPRYLDGINKSVPGGANRIVTEWEKQGEHDREMDRQSMELTRIDVRNQHTITSRGQIFAIAALILAFACALLLAFFDKREVAIAFIGLPILGVAIAFLRGGRLPSLNRSAEPPEPSKSP